MMRKVMEVTVTSTYTRASWEDSLLQQQPEAHGQSGIEQPDPLRDLLSKCQERIDSQEKANKSQTMNRASKITTQQDNAGSFALRNMSFAGYEIIPGARHNFSGKALKWLFVALDGLFASTHQGS
jgi:hypothetical protein